MRLLLTRPEPDNARSAALLRGLGHDVIRAPLLRIEALAGADLGAPPFAAVLLSSANAARSLASHSRRGEIVALPVLAVGRGTAEAAREIGFADVVSADGDSADLSRLAAARFAGTAMPLLYLAGEDRARDLAAELAGQGLAVRTVVSYRAVKEHALPDVAREALEHGRIEGVLHFSRRSVEAYLECGRDMLARALTPLHYCLSERTAAPLRSAGAARVRVAPEPSEAGLVAMIASQA